MKIERERNIIIPCYEIAFIETVQSFRLEVSEQNHVAIHVAKGIETLMLDCSSFTTKLFRRDLILASKEFPLEKFLRSRDNRLLWSSNLKQLTEISQHPDASRLLVRSSGATTVIDFKFSPAYHNVCFLAMVTSLGALTVHQNIAEEWVQVYDVSNLWLAECTPRWIQTDAWPEWKSLMEEGKPASVCWVKEGSHLYLIAALINGDAVVFLDRGEGELLLVLMAQLASGLREPSCVHAFSCNGDLCIVIGAYSGQMAALFVDTGKWELRKVVRLWEEADYLEPKRMVSLKAGSSQYLVTSKTHYLLVHTFSPDGSVTPNEVSFGSSIVGVSTSDTSIYVTLHNMTLVELSVPSLDVLGSIDSGALPCQDGVTSSNGHLMVVAGASGDRKTRISLLAKVDANPGADLRAHRDSRRLTDSLDLLWLHKACLLGSNCAGAGDDSTWPHLQYWELQLSLFCGHHDEATREQLSVKMKQLENSLIQAYAANDPDVQPIFEKIIRSPVLEDMCAVCGGGIIYSDMRVIRCQFGHTVVRCCFSLRPCPATCSSCVLCAAKTTSENSGSLDLRQKSCPFCGGFFQVTTVLL